MITPLTITSLDQGKALARRQVERIYAEPAPQVIVEATKAEDVTTSAVPAPLRRRLSLVARLLSLLDAALPLGARRA